MKKYTYVFGVLALSGGIVGGLLYNNHREHQRQQDLILTKQGYVNQMWQESFRPRADKDIALLAKQGLDTRRAKALCDRTILTVDEGSMCIDELERLENALEGGSRNPVQQ